MINAVMESICTALALEFGHDYEIHTEEVNETLEKPCFCIQCISGTVWPCAEGRYGMRKRFRVQYLPMTEQRLRECNEIADRIIWCLALITVEGNGYQGTKMMHEMTESTLDFYVDYEYYVCKTEENVPMESLVSQTKGK
ncbi:MAG: hypothetical protein HFH82_07755 [Lachnospiraceae bacterium]|nr:hypothetical protein [Lachnospiraceae bacterium]